MGCCIESEHACFEQQVAANAIITALDAGHPTIDRE
jgi:hypothetical protein